MSVTETSGPRLVLHPLLREWAWHRLDVAHPGKLEPRMEIQVHLTSAADTGYLQLQASPRSGEAGESLTVQIAEAELLQVLNELVLYATRAIGW